METWVILFCLDNNLVSQNFQHLCVNGTAETNSTLDKGAVPPSRLPDPVQYEVGRTPYVKVWLTQTNFSQLYRT
jgi:hypothetical protein